jgi:hypothetical protein
MAELLVAGTTATDSTEFTLADGQRKTLFIKPASGTVAPTGALYTLKIKTSGATWVDVTDFDANDCPFSVDGNGTFKASRQVSVFSTGLDGN